MPPPGFTMLDNPAIEQGYAVGPSAFLVYAAIARHVNEQRRAWPGVERLVAITGLSNRSVRYGIDRLEKAGWLIVERQAGQRNVYRLPPVQSMATDCQPPEISKAVDCQGVGQPVAAGEATSCQGVGQPVAAEVDLRSKPNKKTQGSRPKRGFAAEVVFPSELDCESFKEAWQRWIAYRRKRHLSCLPECLKGQLGKLAVLGAAGAVAEINEAITNSWQSVCYKSGANGNARKNGFPCGSGQRHASTPSGTGVW
jgi:hypothetical protein